MTTPTRTAVNGLVPHLAIARPVMRQGAGVEMVRVYCRQATDDDRGPEVPTTRATRNPGKVGCPACAEYAAKILPRGTRVQVHDPGDAVGQPAVIEGWEYGEPRFKYMVRYANGCVVGVDEYRVRERQV